MLCRPTCIRQIPRGSLLNAERALCTTAPADDKKAVVPRISIERFRYGSAVERAAEIDNVKRAFEEQGMALLGDHGIPSKVISDCEEQSRQFFALDAERKASFCPPEGFHPRTYSAISTPRGKAYTVQQRGDSGEIINEWLLVRDTTPSADPAVAQLYDGEAHSVAYDPSSAYFNSPEGREFYTPESAFPHQAEDWPEEVPRLCEATGAYYQHVQTLAATMYEIFALALGAEKTFFTDRARHAPIWPVTIAHYPKQTQPPPPGSMRIQPHWDRTLFSLVATNDTDNSAVGSGLQILVDRDTGHGADGRNFDNAVWRDVPVEPSCLVLNVGEMMARWTNGRFKHVVHRVPNPTAEQAAAAERGRVSMMAYVIPDYDVPCVAADLNFSGEPLDEEKYEPTWIGEMMNWDSQLDIYDTQKQERMRVAQGLYLPDGTQSAVATPTDVNEVQLGK